MLAGNPVYKNWLCKWTLPEKCSVTVEQEKVIVHPKVSRLPYFSLLRGFQSNMEESCDLKATSSPEAKPSKSRLPVHPNWTLV